MASSARWMRWASWGRIRAAASGSSFERRACNAGQPSRSASARRRSRSSGSADGIAESPRSSARKYKPVPPTSKGAWPRAVIACIADSASSRNIAAEYGSDGSRMSIKTCGWRRRVSASGLAAPMSSPRYTSAESTLTSSTGKRVASAHASAVLPVAVGPIRKIAGGRGSMASAWRDMRGLYGSSHSVDLMMAPYNGPTQSRKDNQHAEHDEGTGQARRRQGHLDGGGAGAGIRTQRRADRGREDRDLRH